ncbi:MAG: hypothetical protein ACHRHE_23515 [Tepidisphaerales bacterium]
MAKPDTLIDTCCLVNVCAVDEPASILPQIPLKWYLARSVEREEISIRPHPDAKRHERRRIDLSSCIASGILQRCDAESKDELELYVRLASKLDDGEAMPLAIAAVRKWAVATDDIAAIKVAHDLGVVTLSTPELIRLWARQSNADAMKIAEAIKRIETLARYVPSSKLAAADWWQNSRR